MVSTVGIVKETLTAREVAEHYGIRVTDKGFCCCPFHNEKTPSMKLYRGQGGFYCFGCGKSGDIITFVQLLFGIGFKQAVYQLCEDFNIPYDQTDTIKNEGIQAEIERKKATWQEQQTKLKRLEDAYNERYDQWVSACIKLEEFKMCRKSIDEMFRLTKLMWDKDQAEMELNRAEFTLNEYRTKCNRADKNNAADNGD